MSCWTPLVTGMFWLRVVLLLLGIVWLRHAIVTVMILMREVNVERESHGIYRLTAFADGTRTCVTLHGETQGELSKSGQDSAFIAEAGPVSETRYCRQ